MYSLLFFWEFTQQQAVQMFGDMGDLMEWKEITGEYVYPVREESYFDGEMETVTEIVSIERASIPAEVFEVPAGFTKL